MTLKSHSSPYNHQWDNKHFLAHTHSPIFIHEWEKCHTLPSEFLPVEVNLEVFRVEVYDDGLGVDHELGPGVGDVGATGGREDAHQLLQGVEWLTQGKLHVGVGTVGEV